MFFNHDSETFERIHRGFFQEKSAIREITMNTEKKSSSQVADEILCNLGLI
jgi:hypothetical protein